MDLTPFVVTLLAAALPVLGLLGSAAWLAGSGVERVRIASRDGRILAELVLAAPSRPARGTENPAWPAFRP